jgi:GT2 family glycosyltransferase
VVLVDQPPTRFGTHPIVTHRIETDHNVGFAAACNLGVAHASAPFVLLINNDAWLADGAVPPLLAALAALEPDVAGACLKLLYPDGETIQSAGGLWFTRDGIGFPRALGETDRGQHDRLADHQIGVPSGAAAVYRTSAWREAGGMAEEFFCYCEDGDIGLAMVAAGHRFAWLPAVRVLHELSSSSSAHSQFKAFHVERNHFAVALHSESAATLAALPLFSALRIARMSIDALAGRGAGAGLASESGAGSLASTLVRAWTGALAMLPGALARRRELARRFPGGADRVARFLATRRVPLSDLLRSRNS